LNLEDKQRSNRIQGIKPEASEKKEDKKETTKKAAKKEEVSK
jgi:hypothetical protein